MTRDERACADIIVDIIDKARPDEAHRNRAERQRRCLCNAERENFSASACFFLYPIFTRISALGLGDWLEQVMKEAKEYAEQMRKLHERHAERGGGAARARTCVVPIAISFITGFKERSTRQILDNQLYLTKSTAE